MGEPWTWDEAAVRKGVGHRSRIVAVIELVEHITGHLSVWFATHAQVARYLRGRRGGAVRRR